jgi:hypothetical protein
MFNDWAATKETLLKGLSDKNSEVVGKLLDNQKAVLEGNQPTDDDISGFKKVLLPMIRRIIPSTIAADIVGVQPMSGPSGTIFSMKPNYSSWLFFHEWLVRMFGSVVAEQFITMQNGQDAYYEQFEKYLEVWIREKINVTHTTAI